MTSPHPYGPHRPEDAPNAVTVLPPGTTQGGRPYPAPEVRPLPEALVRQRQQLNDLAHQAALELEPWQEAVASALLTS